MDHFANRFQPNAGHHCQGDLVDHIAGLARYNCGAENFVGAFFRMHFNKALFLAIGHCAIIFVKVNRVGIDLNPFHTRLMFIESDMGNLWVGIGTPGHLQISDLFAPIKERILDYDFGRRGRGMGKFVFHRHVTSGIDTGIAGLHILVDQNATPWVGLYPNLIQTQALNIGQPTGRD